jgi:hypothetical protein
MAVGIRCSDHATRSIHKKLTLISQTIGGRSRTKAKEFIFLALIFYTNFIVFSKIKFVFSSFTRLLFEIFSA